MLCKWICYYLIAQNLYLVVIGKIYTVYSSLNSILVEIAAGASLGEVLGEIITPDLNPRSGVLW